jgi:hypothetical protein
MTSQRQIHRLALSCLFKGFSIGSLCLEHRLLAGRDPFLGFGRLQLR